MELSFPIKIPDFQADFEDIHLFVKEMEIALLMGAGPEDLRAMAPHPLLREDNLNASGFIGQKDVTGKLYCILPSEMSEPILAINVNFLIRARPTTISQSADVLCKVIHFLYRWIEKWAEENEIQDNNNQPFKIPPFLYSRGSFLKHFPEEDLPQ